MTKNERDNKRARSGAMDEQARRRRLMRMVVIPVIAIVVVVGIGLGGWSYYNSKVKPFNQPVLRVNDTTFDMGYYVNTMNIYYGNVSPNDLSDYTTYSEQQIDQFAYYIEELIVRNEIIKQGSALEGVTIDPDTIKDKIKKLGISVTDERIDIMMAEALMDEQVPQSQPQVHAQVMLAESEAAAQDIIAQLKAGQSFEQLIQDRSRLANSTANGDLGWLTAREVDLAVEATDLGDAVVAADATGPGGPVYDDGATKQFGYWVMKVIEKQDVTDNVSARVHVKGVLLGSQEEADSVIDKLNAGEDIDEVAKQYSQSMGADENGATDGWITQSEELGDFNELFDLSVDEISTPIPDAQSQTTGGYWVYNIVEKDNNRELTAEQKDKLDGDLVDTFVRELNEDPDFSLERMLTDDQRVFAINETVLAQGKGSVLIRNGSLPDGEAKLPYSAQLEAYGNQNGNTWTITEGSLPKGLSLNTKTGIISGTPEFAGASSLKIMVSSSTHHWEQEYVLHVHLAVKITTESLDEGRVGESYVTTLELLGDSNLYDWTVTEGEVPEGLQLYSTSGRLSGTPVTAGTYNFTVQVDDGFGKDTKSFTMVINEADISGTNTESPSE